MTTRQTCLVASVCAAFLLSAAAWGAWVWVPRWFPVWTARHSPWLRPAMRACVGANDLEPLDSLTSRIGSWPNDPTPALMAALGDQDAQMRAVAITLIAFRDRPVAVECEDILLRLATSDGSTQVRDAAMWAIGNVGSYRMLEKLQALAEATTTSADRDKIEDAMGGVRARTERVGVGGAPP